MNLWLANRDPRFIITAPSVNVRIAEKDISDSPARRSGAHHCGARELLP
jgi:hypothetical protein